MAAPRLPAMRLLAPALFGTTGLTAATGLLLAGLPPGLPTALPGAAGEPLADYLHARPAFACGPVGGVGRAAAVAP